MLNHAADAQFFTDFFAAQPAATVLEPFVFDEVKARHTGGLHIATAKGLVDLTVHLPEAYPQGEARFFPVELRGYAHQNTTGITRHGGSLCLATPACEHLVTRLELEMQQLLGWLDKYYVREEADEHYEYIPISQAKDAYLLFDEESADYSPTRFEQQQSGTFTYCFLRPSGGATEVSGTAPPVLASGLGNLSARWATNQSRGRQYTGFWVVLGAEPVQERKRRITHWQDLLPLLPSDFGTTLRQLGMDAGFRRQSPKQVGSQFLLAIGYLIPGATGLELTWDVLLVPLSELRRDASVVKTESRLYSLGQQPLRWGASSNAAYSRFFGRGQLPAVLTNQRVLIVGLGALGSCLSEMLVRGGLRQLGLADFDVVAPGNVCRSRLRFSDTQASKIHSHREHLLALSPFLTVTTHPFVATTLPGAQDWTETAEWLRSYDWVFDCSADNQVLATLQAAVPAAQLVHLSITEGAEQLIAVVGNMACPLGERRQLLLAQLARPAYPEFREGTGCWHPTFRAAGADVEALLGLAVGELAAQLHEHQALSTFCLHRTPGRGIRVSTDHLYTQVKLGLSLLVTGECLDQLVQLTHYHQPKEFGGVLVGSYCADGHCAVVSQLIIPAKYRQSPTSFAPDPASINEQLRALSAPLHYLGDWHSHPNGPAQPSATDRATLARLAAHPQVQTHTPLLLIVQTRQQQVFPHFYVFQHGQLHAYASGIL